jgi:hypothetical protein
MRDAASSDILAVWKRAAPRNRMREIFTSGSVGGLVEQSLILPGSCCTVWSGASSPAGVGLEHGRRMIEVPQELGRVLLFLLLGNSRLEIPGYQLQALTVHSSGRERKQRVQPRYRQAKETKCGEMAVG